MNRASAGRATSHERILLSLSPSNNLSARCCWDDVRRGRSWEESTAEDAERAERLGYLH